jgi:pimeloyl-ACP methyl ester carboxylesterase
MLSLALLCCTELLPAQTTNCDNTTIPTLTPPAGLVDVDPDTLLRESACTPGAMGTRTPLILIHGLDGTSDISNPDLSVFMDLSLFLTQQDPSFSQKYKIFTYHYLGNEYTVSEIGLALETWLDYFRQSWDPYGEGDTPFDRDVVIIGHSMGGLVARALMNEDFISAGAKAGLPAGERVIRAITLAAPHHGTALVNSTTLRVHGQSEPSWSIVLDTMDLGWAVNCPACVTNITLPNRGDLRCDAYCANDIFSSTPTLYSGDDVNEWLNNLASTYNSKVNAYYGSLGSYGEVPTYGADDATAIDTEMITLALALGEESLQPSSTAGLTSAELADFHDLLQLMSIIQERIDLDSWSGSFTSVLNDGAVPEISASFEGATVAKRVSCVTSDHVDMLEGTGGLCTDQTTGLTGTLFSVLDADLESLVPGGTGTGPLANLSPTSLSFAGQGLGTTSAAATVTLSDPRSVALSITSIAITGTNAGDFAQTNTCGGSVAAETNCAINITFEPLALGTRTASLTITDDAANSPQTVSLSGVGTAPLVSFSAGSLSFASQPTGTTSPAQAETVTNTGTGNLTISTVTISGTNAGDFAKSADTCTGATVAPNGTCTVSVTFTPSAAGSRSASLNFTDNASGSLQTVSLTGAGVATASVAGVSPGSLTFGSQNLGTTSGSQPVSLSNTGNAALTITGMAASANFGQTNNCGTSVAANGSCTINVSFAPTATGTLTGTLTITDNTNGVAGSTQSVALSGTGQDFSFAAPSGSPTSVTVAPGSPAIYTLSVGGEGGFNQSVSFTCTEEAISEATCTVPNPVTVGSSATNVTITVTTTAPSLGAPRSRPLPPVPPLPPGLRGLLMLALVLALMAWAIGRRNPLGVSRWRSTLVLLAAGLLLTLALAGCGGGAGSTNVTHNSGTPAGTYTLTVTGTAGSGSATLSHSVTLTLNVS